MISGNGVLELFVSILAIRFHTELINFPLAYSINPRLLAVLCGSVVTFLLSALLVRFFLAGKKKQLHKNDGSAKLLHIGFFHPYCNAGGGGERVLWCAIRGLLKK